MLSGGSKGVRRKETRSNNKDQEGDMVVKSEEDAPAPPGHVGRPCPGEHFDPLTLVELFDLVRQKYTHGSGEAESSDQSIATMCTMCTTPSYETDVKVKHQQIVLPGNFAKLRSIEI